MSSLSNNSHSPHGLNTKAMVDHGLLGGAIAFALLALLCGVQRPTSTLTPEDLSHFANGGRVAYTKVNPYLPLTVVFSLLALATGGAWAARGSAGTVPIAVPLAGQEAQPQPWNGIVPLPGDPKGPVVGNLAAVMARRMKPTLGAAITRVGKSLTICHAYRLAQEWHDAEVWLIQPKYHPDEQSYWADCDHRLGFMAEELVGDEEAIAEMGDQMLQFMRRYQTAPAHRPKILIIDELAMLKKVFKSWFKEVMETQILVELSSGETAGRVLWLLTQSGQIQDIGVGTGNRSMLDLFTIQTPTSGLHLESLQASYKSLPDIENPDLFEYSLSPKKAIFYHSALDEWLPLVGYEVPQRSLPLATEVSYRSTPYQKGDSRGFVADVAPLGSGPNTPDLRQILAVTKAIAQEIPDSDIIKTVLGYKGGKYQEGRAILERIKAIIKAEFSDDTS